MIIAGTGHRPDGLGSRYDMKDQISLSVREVCLQFLRDRKPDRIVSGMALGFDTIFALAAIELKIPVLAAIPFVGQESRWPEKSQRLYREILEDPLVESWVVSPGEYNTHKLQYRNECLSRKADLILACWSGAYGGTRNCVLYAQEIGKPVFRFKPGESVIEEFVPLAPGENAS